MHIKKLLIKYYEYLFELKRLLILRIKYRPKIMTSNKTIQYIKRNNCSIARFGDGEFNLMLKNRGIGFQELSTDLSDKLNNVFINPSKNLLICLPRSINTTWGLKNNAKNHWLYWAYNNDNQKKIVNYIYTMIPKKYLFGDAQITRPYIDWKNKNRANIIFTNIKSLWKNKDVLIVEGIQTRMGVGNDLFANAKSIKRILAPATNAFEKLCEIEKSILELHTNEIVLLALGPTATIIAYDLSFTGKQLLDIGHIDIEYEWYLKNSESKEIISGKYTNEVTNGNTPENCYDDTYLSQIIKTIT